MTTSNATTTSRLAKLGLTTAATEIERVTTLKRKLDVAYAQYRFVSPDKIEAFNRQLKEKTFKPNSGLYGQGSYQALTFTSLDKYPAVPPTEVLDALESAMALSVFDAFEVAQITEQSVPKPDPILFGRITGCEDRFYIAQWDEDVKIEDILQGDEGFVKEGVEE